jgi:hypothetical protein
LAAVREPEAGDRDLTKATVARDDAHHQVERAQRSGHPLDDDDLELCSFE